METILGIDLGTTNSVVTILRDGQPHVIPVEDGRGILPSVVGLDAEGRILVGTPARNQSVLAPDRTILSVKRRMGNDETLGLGDRQLTPQEVSAVILGTLKQRAADYLGYDVRQAVITVPAFFTENQRQATREAGELAGLDVVRIINEPTAAALTYEPHNDTRHRLLVYDLGGGTFDVSIVEIEQGIVEVLSSHGDTKLGGDDFDQLLLNHVCDLFQEEHGIDLRSNPAARSRLRTAVEEAKKRLSFEAYTAIEEAYLAEKNGQPLHLNLTIDRPDYEELIRTLVERTVRSVDAALTDAKLYAQDIDQVILVGGATRTPLVKQVVQERLHQEPLASVDPDLCVSMGAALQGALIAGLDVGPVLVDITPHSLGIRCLDLSGETVNDRFFARIIDRNTSLPAKRSHMFYTCVKGQQLAQFDIYQGEHSDATLNSMVGTFTLEGLDEQADEHNEVLVRFDLDVNGTLTATAVERATALETNLTIDNAITRFRAGSHEEARRRLSEVLGLASAVSAGKESAGKESAGKESAGADEAELPESTRTRLARGLQLITRAQSLLDSVSPDDRGEIEGLLEHLETALGDRSEPDIDQVADSLEDLLFYLEDA